MCRNSRRSRAIVFAKKYSASINRPRHCTRRGQYTGPGSKVTPVGLPVLTELRELQFLMVRIDTAATNWSTLGVCSTTVKTLRLDGSNIKDPLTDFRHLLDMFPRVNYVGMRGLRHEICVAIEMLRENKRQRLASSSSSRTAAPRVKNECNSETL
ncbi:hypothetical protein PILCRDRAFT_371039 [Piloderma croceum F 1598]|uniref:Uncharacterized protein n=1 Tax=Piloderma croceum (strain F 1598) TaxID=765440 RepID=A0A0C3FLC2_PILCF|nr:hypothetical protein PILCRDRAFT_371039 [Piloderma croceum F 1598]